MLLELTEAYEKYLDKYKESEVEIDAYRRKVLRAKCANDRLTEFVKRVESNKTLFKEFGFENLTLDFSFLNIIRKVRNDSGHPTGISVPEEELKVLLGNYLSITV